VIYKRKQSFHWPFGAKIRFFGGMITKIGIAKDPKSIQNRSGQK
jgi:hypothetical protein